MTPPGRHSRSDNDSTDRAATERADSAAPPARDGSVAPASPTARDDSGDPPSPTARDDSGDVETSVPEGASAFVCERCGRPFAAERSLALHRGLAHPTTLTDAERTAFADAREAEDGELFRFRIVALGALVALYFGLLFAYALFGSAPV
ncbi:MAG: hypothetical protein ABEJ28_06875 [Salinigranum sp.]